MSLVERLLVPLPKSRLFKEADAVSARGGVEGDADAGGPAADDGHVPRVGALGQEVERAMRSMVKADAEVNAELLQGHAARHSFNVPANRGCGPAPFSSGPCDERPGRGSWSARTRDRFANGRPVRRCSFQ